MPVIIVETFLRWERAIGYDWLWNVYINSKYKPIKGVVTRNNGYCHNYHM